MNLTEKDRELLLLSTNDEIIYQNPSIINQLSPNNMVDKLIMSAYGQVINQKLVIEKRLDELVKFFREPKSKEEIESYWDIMLTELIKVVIRDVVDGLITEQEANEKLNEIEKQVEQEKQEEMILNGYGTETLMEFMERKRKEKEEQERREEEEKQQFLEERRKEREEEERKRQEEEKKRKEEERIQEEERKEIENKMRKEKIEFLLSDIIVDTEKNIDKFKEKINDIYDNYYSGNSFSKKYIIDELYEIISKLSIDRKINKRDNKYTKKEITDLVNEIM